MAEPVTKNQCRNIVRKTLIKANLLELTQGKGDDFANALGDAMYEICSVYRSEFVSAHNGHKHNYTTPDTETGTVTETIE